MPMLAERLDRFGAALLDPGCKVPAGLLVPDGASCSKRFAVYRNNVVARLVGALRAGFPRVARLVGEECFRALTHDFVATHPPDSPVLMRYGAGFPDYLASFPPSASRAYLADVGRIERATIEAYHACDATPLAPYDLATIPPPRAPDLRLALHPSVRLVRSPWPAFSIWAMNGGDGPPDPAASIVPEDTLVVRPRAQVDVRPLPAGAFELLAAIGQGSTLAQALSAALRAQPGFDLAGHLARMIDLGVFSTMEGCHA